MIGMIQYLMDLVHCTKRESSVCKESFEKSERNTQALQPNQAFNSLSMH
jgi:hypothetical protein